MLYIDQFVYSNRMRHAHPVEKVLFAVVTLVVGLIFREPVVSLSVVVIMLGFLIFKAGIPGKVVGKLLTVPLGFLFLGVLTIAVSLSSHPEGMIFSVPVGNYYLGVTESSLKTAQMITLQALSSVCCLYFLALTVPMIELIDVLQLFRFPPVFVELMMLIYRFIFIFIDTAFNIYTAQSSRWGYAGYRRSIYSFGMLFGNLWGKVFFKSQALFTSLQSRGYEQELKVLSPPYVFSPVNIAVFCLIDLGLVILGFC